MTKTELLQAIKNDEFLKRTRDFTQAVYIIGNYMVSGNFQCGLRTVDHADLLVGNTTWEELIHYGTVLVPEHETAIGRKHEKLCKMHGYKMLPCKKNNHIMGYN